MDIHLDKKDSHPYLKPYIKIKSKSITDLNVEGNSKISRRHCRRKALQLWDGQIVLN